MIRETHDLVVRDDYRNPDLAADAERLLERLEHPVAFVAHVRAIEPARFAQRTADLDHLLGGRRAGRLVVEAGRNTDRTRAERLAHHLAHAPDLVVARGALEVVHRRDPQRRVADQQRGIGCGGRFTQRGDIRGESPESEPRALVVEQVEGRRDRPRRTRRQRRERDPAVAGDDGRDPLAHLRGHLRRRQHQAVVVRMGVDEAGRDDPARGVDLDGATRADERSDAGDPVAGHRDVGDVPGRARAVDDGAVPDDEIEPLGHISRPSRRRASRPRPT